MLEDGQGIKCRRNIAENFNPLGRVHERYRRQTDDRQTDGRAIASSERALAKIGWSTDGGGLGLKFFEIILF